MTARFLRKLLCGPPTLAVRACSSALRVATPVALALLGCSQPAAVSLSVRTWWQSDAEKMALRKLTDMHRQLHPNVTFETENQNNEISRRNVAQQLINGAAPDTYQANIGAGLLQWALRGSSGVAEDDAPKLTAVSDMIDPSAYQQDLIPYLTLGGELYGVPLEIHRTNMIYYRSDLNLDFSKVETFCAPTDTENFIRPTQCEPDDGPPFQRAENAVVMALATEDWTVQSFVFEALIPAVAGPDVYKKYFEPTAADTFDELKPTLARVLRCARDLKRRFQICTVPDWTYSVNVLVHDSHGDESHSADFTVGGDWIGAELEARYPSMSSDIQGTEFPSTDPNESVFVFTSDVFPLPKKAPNNDEARDFLRTVASANVQREFSKAKGSIPALKGARGAQDGVAERQRAFENAHRRLVATSGVIPPEYPRELARVLRNLIINDDENDEKLAMQWLELGFPLLQAWQVKLHAP